MERNTYSDCQDRFDEGGTTMPTKPDTTGRELSVEQRNAIDLLVTGTTDVETAEAVGVTRQTVNGWRNHHPAFIAALNARRLEIWGTACDRLRAMLPKALDALDTALAADPPDWRAASKVLELAGLDRPRHGVPILAPEFIGPANAEAVLDAAARWRRRDPMQDLLDGGPVTEGERQVVIRELSAKLQDGADNAGTE